MHGRQRDVYISTTSFRSRRFAGILEVCQQYAIEALELSAVQDYDPALIGSTTYPSRYLVHNYFPPPPRPILLNLASQDEATLDSSLALCRAALDLSARVGGAVYAAHGGFNADLSPEVLGDPDRQAEIPFEDLTPPDRAYETLLESARALTGYARARGVKFLIENHVLSTKNGPNGRLLLPMVTGEELARLAADVADDNFGVLVDVGHLNVSAATLAFSRDEFIDEVGPYVGAFHLSDNDGITDQHRAFDDDAWFLPRLAEFPQATITVELASADIDEILTVRETVSRWL